MEQFQGPDDLLARLMASRRLDVGALSRTAGVPEAELQAVVDGTPASPLLLHQLAAALDLHAADLFVIAGAEVPDDLAPLDANAKPLIPGLLTQARHLPTEQRRRLRHFVRTLPQQDRTQPVPPPRPWEQYPPGIGAVLVRLLHNRNLDWTTAVRVLAELTGLGLSAATIGVIGRGRKELTPGLLTDLATVLGIPATTLATLANIELPADNPQPDPATADIAELIWDIRNLTADQLRQVCDQAISMRADVIDGTEQVGPKLTGDQDRNDR